MRQMIVINISNFRGQSVMGIKAEQVFEHVEQAIGVSSNPYIVVHGEGGFGCAIFNNDESNSICRSATEHWTQQIQPLPCREITIPTFLDED